MTINELMSWFKGWLDLDWRTKDQCISWIKNRTGVQINERELRNLFAQYCEEYIVGYHDSYLAHSSKGYLLTSDVDIIRKSIQDDKSRMDTLSRRVWGVEKRLKQLGQITLLPNEEKEMDAYEIISRMSI